jgi:hypothetical protein
MSSWCGTYLSTETTLPYHNNSFVQEQCFLSSDYKFTLAIMPTFLQNEKQIEQELILENDS